MRKILVTAVLAALLAAPVGTAAWGARGLLEPDTDRDVRDGWMWKTADSTPGTARKVYFNGFQGQYWGYGVGVSSAFSPNSAALGTSHQTYPFMPWAMLGVWKDCNKDGYVGLGDQGLWEYRIELLQGDTSVCPVQAVPNPIPDNWAPVHNDGTWVHEFLPIGWDSWKTSVANDGTVTVRPNDYNPWNFNDSGSRVWGDWNLPEDPIGRSCYVNPHPRGTYQHTGNFLDWADCFFSGRLHATGDLVADRTGTHALWEQAKDTKNPWGYESDDPYVDAFDCSDHVFEPRDPTWDGESGVTHPSVPDPTRDGQPWYPRNLSDSQGFIVYGANVSRPNTSPSFNPSGSMAGTLNETEADRGDCDRSNNRYPTVPNLPYILEGDVENTDGKRHEPDHTLFFSQGRRDGGTQQQLGRHAPRDLGVRILGLEGCMIFTTAHLSFCNEGFWNGDTVTGVSRNPYVSRDTLQPMGVTYITYYATLSPGAISTYGLTLPAGSATGRYGAEHCGSTPTGQWECDSANWWPGDTMKRDWRLGPDPSTTHLPRNQWRAMPVGVSVDQPFHLRDIDCFDESVSALRSNGIHYGILTSTECRSP